MRRLLPTMLLLAAWPVLGSSDAVQLEESTSNWSAVAQLAQRRGLPVVILVSEPDCGYCIRLKTDVLRPMQRQGRLQERAIVRELRMRTRGKLTDFDGERVRGPVFLGRYQVFAAPTLLFLDPRGGILRDPIVGYNGKERFQPLLEEALTQSRAALSLTAVAQAMPTSP